MNPLRNFGFFLAVLVSQDVFAAGSANVFHTISHAVGLPTGFESLVAAAMTVLICLVLGLVFKAKVSQALATDLKPSRSFGVLFAVEALMDFLHNLSVEQLGKDGKRFLPILTGLFVFILFSNLMGLVPGFPPPTGDFSINLAMGAVAFLVYNYAGIKEHGLGYVKQFTGPFLVLAPMFIGLELVSHCARPLSLAFRLTANIFGDHLLLGVFASMVPVVVPSALLFFGLLVACIQSFVFTVLTSIYISLAVSHDH